MSANELSVLICFVASTVKALINTRAFFELLLFTERGMGVYKRLAS